MNKKQNDLQTLSKISQLAKNIGSSPEPMFLAYMKIRKVFTIFEKKLI